MPEASVFPNGLLDDAVELGAVDSRSVRLWVRHPGATEVRARLEVEGQPPVEAAIALSADTDWTGAIVLELPDDAPGQPFVCFALGQQLRGRLAPLPDSHAGLVFAFGSCHRPFKVTGDGRLEPNRASGIYPAMAAELKRRDARMLLLLGDQVYSDELPPVSVRDNLPGDEQQPPPLEMVIAAYRRVSRGFLGQAGIRRLRERFPTYCIWDDHDIFNNWGSRLEKTPRDQRLFEAASRVYSEYQHQRNPGRTYGPPPYHYSFRYGDIGFFVLDVRGARDYQHGRLLGEAQWDAFAAYLKGEDTATIQTLFVISSIPVAHISRWMAKLFDRLPGDNGNAIRDRWCAAAFVESRDTMLEMLATWQTAAPGRQVCLLSGDVHAASAFTIRRRTGGGVIQQFTSSALTTPNTISQRILNALVVRLPNLFEPRFHFRRRLLTFSNNYGLVRVQPLPKGGHRVTFTVRAWHARQQRLRTAGRVVASPRRGQEAGS